MLNGAVNVINNNYMAVDGMNDMNIQVSQLNPGPYQLSVTGVGKAYVGNFIKL